MKNYYDCFMLKVFYSITILFFFCSNFAFGADFGEYKYSKYLGIQQQLQNQRIMAQRQRMRYNQSPTRNIRYPRTSNSYPNIERQSTRQLTRNERYSSAYYAAKYARQN